MPRYRRRSYYRSNPVVALVILLVIAIVLLVLIQSGQTYSVIIPDFNLPRIELPPLPNITIPITGLPEVQIPDIRIPVTVEPGTLVPGIIIAGTPAPAVELQLGARTKTDGCRVQGSLPDRACTPGSVIDTNPEQICQAGYAGSVRDVSQVVRDQVYAEYDIANQTSGQYQLDHLVPLSLGGSNDISNLWSQPASPTPGYAEKDAVENYLHDQVCSGRMGLAEAQRAIAVNWVAVYNQMPK